MKVLRYLLKVSLQMLASGLAQDEDNLCIADRYSPKLAGPHPSSISERIVAMDIYTQFPCVVERHANHCYCHYI